VLHGELRAGSRAPTDAIHGTLNEYLDLWRSDKRIRNEKLTERCAAELTHRADLPRSRRASSGKAGALHAELAELADEFQIR